MLRFCRFALPWCLLALLSIFGSCTRRGGTAELGTVNSGAQLRSLPPAEAVRGYPVRLHGTVTFYDEQYRILTVQDETGGVFVDPREQELDNLVPGVAADVEGYSGFEEFDPVVIKPKIRAGAQTTLPNPRKVALSRVLDGFEDFQFVEIAGRLQSVSLVNNVHLRFVVQAQARTLEVIVSTQNPVPDWPAGTEIVARGVAFVSRDAQGVPNSARLHVSGFQDLQAAVPAKYSPLALSAPGAGLPLLTQVDQLKRLSPAEAGKRYPVRVKGVVNLHNLKSQTAFFQDATGGVYVTLKEPVLPRVSPGTVAEVEGISHPGDFAPSIHQARLRVIASGRMFPPVEISQPDQLSLTAENRWARIRGVARKTSSLLNPGVQIDLEVKGQHFPVDVMGGPRTEKDSLWIDAELEAEGILGALFDENRSLEGFHLIVPSREFVKLLRPAPANPFANGAAVLRQLFEFSLDRDPRHRLKVAGTVTASRLGGSVYIAAGSSSTRLQTSGVPGLRVGDKVDAVGFLPLGARIPVLEAAELRVLGPGSPQKPADSNAEDLLTGASDTGLVRLEGRLIDRRRSFGDEVLTLRAGKSSFTAVLEQPQPDPAFDALRPGSMLGLTGVCDMQWDPTHVPPAPVSFRLVLRSPDDVTVVRLASWWTARNTAAVLAVVCALAIVALVWVFTLQRRVNRQTALLAARLERENQLQAQLSEAQKLETVGRLAGGVAHDFNNLLTVINGYGDLILTRLDKVSPLRPPLEQIRRAGERAAVLTQQLLGFSRRQVIQPKPVNLNTLVSEALGMLQPLLGERIRIETELDPTLDHVSADPVQVDQILMNLAANAQDAMPDGGALRIQTRNIMVVGRGDNAPAELPPGTYVMLSVTDTGAGMSPETQQHIFEPFFTTKPRGRGTGLGLATVYGIVKQNGGWIFVESELGKGTSFQIYLAGITGHTETSSERVHPSFSVGFESLLVVEDEDDVRSFAVEVLKSCGYSVLAAADAESALELAGKCTQPIDLLLTDVVLPGMNGRQLAKCMKANRPHMQVLFASGYAQDVIAENGILEAGTDYIAKPYAPADLAAKVKELLSKRRDNPA